MPKLFISYAREDQQWVEAFSRALVAAGFEVWRDNAIATGEPFGRVIERAIADANAVVVVWSKDSIESDWVRAEATEGLRREILIPVQRDVAAPPLRFRTLQTLDLSDWRFDPDYPTFGRLVHELHLRMDGADGAGTTAAGGGAAPGAASLAGAGGMPRRRWVMAAAAVLALLAVALFWFLDERRGREQTALELSAAAQAERAALLTEHRASRRYWYYYLADLGGKTRVERVVLLALEAARLQRTPERLAQLREALLLLSVPRQRWRLGDSVARVALSAERKRLAWTNRHGLWIRDLGVEHSAQLSPESEAAGLVLLEPTGHLLVLGSNGGASLWSPEGDNRLWQVAQGGGRTLAFAVSGDAARLALLQPGLARIIALTNGEIEQRIAIGEGYDRRGAGIALSQDGRYVALAGNNRLQIHDLETRRALHRVEFAAAVTALAFDPSDNGLLLALKDGKLIRLSLPFAERSEVAAGLAASSLRFSPGGARLALAAGARVRVVAAQDPQQLLLEYRHDDRVTGLSFSDDGARIVSAGQEGEVRVFDLSEGRELARVSHPDMVLASAFGAEAKSLITIGRVGRIELWPIDYDSPEIEACRRLTRALTPDEWRRFLPGRAFRPSCPDRAAGG